MTAPTLVFGWGNPSRGDDALGPLFVEALEALAADHPEWGEVDFLTDFQLQIENSLDLQGRQRVLFVDAHLNLTEPCTLSHVAASKDSSFTSHVLSPQALLHVWESIESAPPPSCSLLSLRAQGTELGYALSSGAEFSLEAGLALAGQWLATQHHGAKEIRLKSA